jgi:RNA polymerase sigma-70 factor (ECF subfamily)
MGVEESSGDPGRAAELAARTSYGRLIAFLAGRSGDVAAAEDALADAFRTALETWPRAGVPDRPEAWLLTVARRRMFKGTRHEKVKSAVESTLALLAEERLENSDSFPDHRLKLMLICAHPAIDVGVRTPLMLQTVLGLDAARIASAFLTAPSAMGQRLVRAKAKIRLAGIPFELPPPEQLPDRIDGVLEAIYTAYGSGWDALSGDARIRGLSQEAIWLGQLAARLAPGSAEAEGLVALMLHCEARLSARRDAQGCFVPLAEQDVALWSHGLIEAAETRLRRAFSLIGSGARMGRFQMEAAIQSVHAERRLGLPVNWTALVSLYDLLLQIAPTLGGAVARAAALGEAEGPVAGLHALDLLSSDRLDTYQPFWAVRAHLMALARKDGANLAYERAIGLTEDAATRAFLRRRQAESDPAPHEISRRPA